MAVVVRNIRRADRAATDALADYGAATIHEAQGRTGLLAPHLRPIYAGAHIAGTAVTVSVPPADNWMIHVAVEQCQEGDVLVVAPTSRSEAGYVGELIATALRRRGVRGLVIDAGCRDVAELTRMGFPVWSRCVSAAGTVKETHGVVAVPRGNATEVLAASRAREHSEAANRARYRAGELSLDVHRMRERLEQKGLEYVDQAADD